MSTGWGQAGSNPNHACPQQGVGRHKQKKQIKQKIQITQPEKYLSNVTLANKGRRTKLIKLKRVTVFKNTKKCQPVASRLASPPQKINRTKKLKSTNKKYKRKNSNKCDYSTNVTMMYQVQRLKQTYLQSVKTYKNTKKCQPVASRLAHPPKIINRTKKFKSTNKTWSTSCKHRNKCAHCKNGNRNSKTLKILEWNLGSKHWIRKQDLVQAIVDEHNPDLMFITEANVFRNYNEQCLNIDRYLTVKPHTWDHPDLQYARVILLIKPDINFTVLDMHMEPDISSIWIKVSSQGRKNLVIGGLYREHKFLKQDDDISASLRSQEDRWRRMIQKWAEQRATTGCESIVIGDMNLDQLTWHAPTHAHKHMIEQVKNEIETRIF